MKYQENRFTLDLQKHQSHTIVNVFQGDTAVRLYISLTDGGKPYTLNPAENHATLYGMRPDGQPLVHECKVISEAEIMYEFQPATSYVLGIVNCQCRIFSREDELLTAPRFSINVEERVVDDDEYSPSDEEISKLAKIFVDEAGRVENETVRQLNEFGGTNTAGDQVIGRVAAEQAREAAEAERDRKETARGEAEKSRAAAETARVDAEKLRAAAETARKEADKTRDEKIQSAIDIANDALELAGVAGGDTEDVGTTIASGINTHNSSSEAHQDIRTRIETLLNTHNQDTTPLTHADIRNDLATFKEAVNAILNSDDTSLDQLKEIVTYIKANKDLIDGITTTKVNVSDIVDNLNSTATNKPLSANQGNALNALIDEKVAIKGNKSVLRRAYIAEKSDDGTTEKKAVTLVDMRTGYDTADTKNPIKASSIAVRGNPNEGEKHPGTFEVMHPAMTPNKTGLYTTNPAFSENHPLTVGMALKYFVTNSAYQALLPKAIAITSFTIDGGSTYENGTKLTKLTVRWQLNQTPTSVMLNSATQQNKTSGAKEYIKTGGFVSGDLWTLVVSDGHTTVSSTITLSFINKVYYGASSSTTVTDELIQGLENELRSSAKSFISVSATEDQYIYYAHPTSYGKVTFKDEDEGFQYGFVLVGDSYSFKNALGYTENYYVYRSAQKISGTSNITIKGGG